MARKIVRLLAALGALVVVVTVTPVTAWWARRLAGPFQSPPPGVEVVVLGGARWEDGVLSGGSYIRAVYAARLGGAATRIVFCGRDVAPYMAALAPAGVPVAIENRSTTTRENALFARPLLTPGARVALLTSDFHMFRALRTFRKAGVECFPVPAPDALKRASRWAGRWPAFLELAEETCKILYYRARGWLA